MTMCWSQNSKTDEKNLNHDDPDPETTCRRSPLSQPHCTQTIFHRSVSTELPVQLGRSILHVCGIMNILPTIFIRFIKFHNMYMLLATHKPSWLLADILSYFPRDKGHSLVPRLSLSRCSTARGASYGRVPRCIQSGPVLRIVRPPYILCSWRRQNKQSGRTPPKLMHRILRIECITNRPIPFPCHSYCALCHFSSVLQSPFTIQLPSYQPESQHKI